MKVISVIGQKGGTGKTTVALHIAACAQAAGIPTAVIDTDPQGSAFKWYERREAEDPQITREMDADALPRLAKAARANGVGLLVIDTPGKAETMALAACELADMIMVPTAPTQFDLETLGTVKRTVRIAERLDRSFVVLNKCPTNTKKPAADAEDAVQAMGLSLVPLRLHQRDDFSAAMKGGQVAQEYDPRNKAAAEAAALFEWIRSQLSLTLAEAA